MERDHLGFAQDGNAMPVTSTRVVGRVRESRGDLTRELLAAS